MKLIPSSYTRSIVTNNSSPAACTPQNPNVAEEVIHFLPMGSSLEEVLAQLRYQGHGEVHTTFLCCTNEMNHISQVPAEEKMLSTDDETSGHRHALRREQKGVVWIKDFTQKFTLPG